VRAVAQQAQGDVHADLRAPAGEQRAPARQVGARVAALVVARGTRRTELVVEGVDLAVALLADVARARLDERARAIPVRRRLQGQPLRLVVDAPRRARRRGGRDRLVVREDRCALLSAPLLLDALVEPRRRALHRDGVGMPAGKLLRVGEDAQRDVEAFGVDAVHLGLAG
jgi:hypothetical protein